MNAMLADDLRFTDRAAARAFEYGINHADVIEALRNPHFKQAAMEHDRFVHYVRIDGRAWKVVTGPKHDNPTVTAVIGLLLLDLENSTGR